MKTYRLDKDLHGPVMVEHAAGGWVSRVDAADLQRQLEETKALLAEGASLVRDQAAEIARLNTELADALAERDAWKGIHDGQQRVYNDIGANLGADMPRELVNEVARRRMAELADLQRQLADAIAERDRYMQIAMQVEAQRSAAEEKKP